MLRRQMGLTVKRTTLPHSSNRRGRDCSCGMILSTRDTIRRNAGLLVLIYIGAAISMAEGAGWASDTRTQAPPPVPSQRSPSAPTASPSGLATPMSQPLLGFAWDQASSTLRQVDGVPGAALGGSAFLRNLGFTAVAIAPNQEIALLTNGTGILYAVALPPPEPPFALATGLAADVRAAFSPSGTTAVLYSPNANSTFVITGMPTFPEVREVTSLAGVTGIFNAIVSDSGVLLVARASASGVSISTAALDAKLTPVAEVGLLGGMTFLLGTDTAVLTDAENSVLWKVSGIGGPASLALLADASDGLSQPGSVAVSLDGKTAWVIAAGSSSILEFSLNAAGRFTHALEAPFPITAFARLNGGSVFALQGPPRGALFVLDGDWPAGRIVQIPMTPLPQPIGGLQ
jgi:hypothetical protein